MATSGMALAKLTSQRRTTDTPNPSKVGTTATANANDRTHESARSDTVATEATAHAAELRPRTATRLALVSRVITGTYRPCRSAAGRGPTNNRQAGAAP